jgi:hypothetical protein
MGMKFTRDPDSDEMCEGLLDYVGPTGVRQRVACMRMLDHAPPCIAMARYAYIADGRCGHCDRRHQPYCESWVAALAEDA